MQPISDSYDWYLNTIEILCALAAQYFSAHC